MSNWDEAKHPRVPAGSAGGGEFSHAVMASQAGQHTFVMIEGKGPLGRGKFAATQGGRTLSNYYADQNQAMAEAKQRLANETYVQQQAQERDRRNQEIAARHAAGGEVTSSDLSSPSA